MANVKVFSMQGSQVGEITLSDEVFGSEIHVSAMHAVVRAYMNAQRQGTQSALTRTEVRGGGRKIYRQKGTGNARHHGRRAPQFTHGGVVFAPKPRDYRISVPRKVRRLAMRSALSCKVAEQQIVVLDKEEAKEVAKAEQEARSGLVNINKASVEELTTLKGIGESRAEDIIRYREEHGGFQKIEDIMKVPGIKESGFQKIKDSITV